MTIPNESVFIADYEKNLMDANLLPFRYHWVLGAALSLAGMLIENPSALLHDLSATAIGLVVFGWAGGLFSKFILMPMFAAPYSQLAKRLGLDSPAA